MIAKASLVAGRQVLLRRAYLEDPQRALSVKWAGTKAGAGADAFHSVVEIGKGYGVSQRIGSIARSVATTTCRIRRISSARRWPRARTRQYA